MVSLVIVARGRKQPICGLPVGIIKDIVFSGGGVCQQQYIHILNHLALKTVVSHLTTLVFSLPSYLTFPPSLIIYADLLLPEATHSIRATLNCITHHQSLGFPPAHKH